MSASSVKGIIENITKLEGESLPGGYEVLVRTSRGVVGFFWTKTPELFETGSPCQIWGDADTAPGIRVFGRRWEGVKTDLTKTFTRGVFFRSKDQ